jgi:hypothetical protein
MYRLLAVGAVGWQRPAVNVRRPVFKWPTTNGLSFALAFPCRGRRARDLSVARTSCPCSSRILWPPSARAGFRGHRPRPQLAFRFSQRPARTGAGDTAAAASARIAPAADCTARRPDPARRGRGGARRLRGPEHRDHRCCAPVRLRGGHRAGRLAGDDVRMRFATPPGRRTVAVPFVRRTGRAALDDAESARSHSVRFAMRTQPGEAQSPTGPRSTRGLAFTVRSHRAGARGERVCLPADAKRSCAGLWNESGPGATPAPPAARLLHVHGLSFGQTTELLAIRANGVPRSGESGGDAA